MSDPLPTVDGLTLPAEIRALLRPAEVMQDHDGRTHVLPRYFYVVANWDLAKATKLTPHFSLAELMAVDCREARGLLHRFPHYVPCAVSLLARYLDGFRQRVGAPVSIAVNGGYRSPSHRFSGAASPHLWGTAANIFRIGDTLLDSQKAVEKYAAIAQDLGPEVFVKPFGTAAGQVDDHLHFDLGYAHLVPRHFHEVDPAKTAAESLPP